jgi:PAS domain S-box-containing protein
MTAETITLAPEIEAHYIAVIEAMPTICHLLKVDAPRFTIATSTPKLFKMTGMKKEAVIGKGIFEAFPSNPSDPNDTGENNLRASLLYVLQHKKSHQLPIQRYDVMDDKGEFKERYWRAENNPILSSTGEVMYILHTTEDITGQVMSERREVAYQELQQAYKKAEESQQRFYTLANSITQLAWIADDKGWIYWYNDRWYDYTGTTLEEMEGWGWEKVHHPDHIERVVYFVKGAWLKDETWELVFPLRRHDGEYRWFLTRGVPVKNEVGQVIQWIGTNTDIDEQKQAEALLEQRVLERTQELELRNRELEQFTHVSHHDLQEPLRKIIMFTDMVKGEAAQKLSEASQIRLQKVVDAASRMSTALRDVLDFASLSKVEEFVAVDLDQVLAGVQSDLELVISEKKATITSDALPTIKGIPNQMHQLLYNLINNALKFSKPGAPPLVTITCTLQEASQMVEHKDVDSGKNCFFIKVQDNGIGFNQDHANKIFDMFQRLHSRDDFSGTGIGLALVKKVVANHGGQVWAESQPGEGATFNLLLPAE